MFSSALKSFTSNISSNYSIAPQPSTYSGPWKIFDAKKRGTGKAVSVFVLDRKTLESQGGSFGSKSSGSSARRAQDEVVDRLKREASSLARLRHPSILELVEPVEETRNGGLMFATEQVTASLAGLLLDKDDQEKAGGVGGRASRYVVEDADGKKRRRELEIDELEIQKGLLQVGKGLEFLHEGAQLVHGNLTPEAIFVNAKSDWKISGLGFAGAGANATGAAASSPLNVHEALNHDPRLPLFVQLDLDYTSPDFVIDNNVSAAADMFSLGLLIIALYNSPRKTPLETHGSVSSYKRIFSSSATVPNQSNNFLSSRPIPKDLAATVLPKLITRRPANRMSAREFQDSQYFDNILVSTIRFLDALPAKTPNEKAQFMRGLPRILNQFPKSVLEKKVMPALLDEMKDKELLSLILQNIFKITELLPSGKRVFTERAIPKFREVFLATKQAAGEKDSAREAGLMVLLENMKAVAANSTGKEFKDDILPIITMALESSIHSLVDAALRTLSTILTILDFSTVKNELFPVIAAVFSKTNSMSIKIRGLEAFQILCGGGAAQASVDDLDGWSDAQKTKTKPKQHSVILDKYSIQEKVVPLLKVIKTKEPAVMMAALGVFTEVGKIADSDYLAVEVLPILWNFSLGPLLNLEQFQAFMALIKSVSTRIEDEHVRKLKDLSANNNSSIGVGNAASFGQVAGTNGISDSSNGEVDFESLVSGRKSQQNDMFDSGWDTTPQTNSSIPNRPTGASQSQNVWSSSGTTGSLSGFTMQPQTMASLQPLRPNASRTITPDLSLNSFSALTPSSNQQSSFTSGGQSAPLSMASQAAASNPWASSPATAAPSINWSSSNAGLSNAGVQRTVPVMQSTPQAPSAYGAMQPTTMTPARSVPQTNLSSFALAPPPGAGQQTSWQNVGGVQQQQAQPTASKQGLDKYESLL